MTRGQLLLTLISICGCDSEPVEVATHQSAVALIDTNSSGIRIGFTDMSKQERLPEVMSGLAPKDFAWVAIVIDSSKLDVLKSDSGLQVNLRDIADPANSITFEQVYIGPCNPAISNFENCLLYEKLMTGSVGVSGTVGVRLQSRADIEYDVVIEGQTDRFGSPTQWHKHGSIGTITAEVRQ